MPEQRDWKHSAAVAFDMAASLADPERRRGSEDHRTAARDSEEVLADFGGAMFSRALIRRA